MNQAKTRAEFYSVRTQNCVLAYIHNYVIKEGMSSTFDAKQKTKLQSLNRRRNSTIQDEDYTPTGNQEVHELSKHHLDEADIFMLTKGHRE